MDSDYYDTTIDPLLPPKAPPINPSLQILSLSGQNIRSVGHYEEPKSVVRKASIVIAKTGVGFWKLYGGLVMALCASVCFSASMLLIKSMEFYGLGAFGGALLFNIGILLPSILAILFNEYGPNWRARTHVFQGLWPIDSAKQWRIFIALMVQACLQGATVICRIYALQYLSMGDMTVIVFSSPVLTTVIAYFVLKEKCGAVSIGIAIFTLIGVILITRPPILTGEQGFDTETLIGFGFAAGALLTLSLTFVTTRTIKDQHVLAMTLTVGLVGVFLSLPLFLIFEEWDSIIPVYAEAMAMTMSFLMAFCAMGSIFLALKMENAGLVALVRSCDVIFAFLLQYIFLGVEPDLLSGIGAGIVWLGVLFAGSHKYWTDRKAKLGFIQKGTEIPDF